MTSRRSLISGCSLGPGNYRRLAVLSGLLILSFVCIGVRLVHLQWFQHEELSQRAERQRRDRREQVPMRGEIRDRRGVLLAGGYTVKTVKADPTLVGQHQELLAQLLSPHLERPVPELVALLAPKTVRRTDGSVAPVRGVILKRGVRAESWEAIQTELRKVDLGQNQPGLPRKEKQRIDLERRNLLGSLTTEPMDEQRRYYPGGALAAHILGFTRRADPEKDGRSSGELVGVEGLERRLDDLLRGLPGWSEYDTVRRGGEWIAQPGSEMKATSGRSVVLTIDAPLQAIVEQRLSEAWRRFRPASITCIVVDPQTGEILALANAPSFDPNRPGDADAGQRRNRAITDLYEPGSTFKVITIGGALDAGIVSLSDAVDCEKGRFQFRGVPLGDLHGGYDVLSVESVLVKSSNIGAAKVGIRMGEPLLYSTVRRFGIGEPTGIPLPGERGGTIRPTANWSKISVAWIPMGHEVAATPLQMVMALSAVANDGLLMRPMLIRRVLDPDGNTVQELRPVEKRRVLRVETARSLQQALAEAVRSGTGRRAQLEQYTVAGKTGTAQKIINGAYVRDRHFSSFIGFFPATRARLCVGVFVDDPRVGTYGGETAAPVFQEVAREAAAIFGIPPDDPVVPVNGTRTLAQRQLEPGVEMER